VAGKPALRLNAAGICHGVPVCRVHGSPQGERDITGMRKEGWKEGAWGWPRRHQRDDAAALYRPSVFRR